MSQPPSVAPFVGLLADLVADLRRGSCCLVTCDKGWVLPIFHDVWKRLKAADVRCEFLDGRPARGEEAPTEVGVMLMSIAQLRKAVRGDVTGTVFALPHLDVMTTSDGGWTNISREVIPLLYENDTAVWLGFRDPSLPLLPVVEKLFTRRYVIDTPFRVGETLHLEQFPPPPVEVQQLSPPPPHAPPEPPSEAVRETLSEAPVEPATEAAHKQSVEEPPSAPPDEAPPPGPTPPSDTLTSS